VDFPAICQQWDNIIRDAAAGEPEHCEIRQGGQFAVF
jgi:hypothetical protein